MPRVKRGTNRVKSRRRVLKLASGYFLTKSKLHRSAREAVSKALKYAYVGRKHRKRDFRRLWIVRINAGCRQHGLSYSKFMHGLKLSGIELNRKMLAELAIAEQASFASLVTQAKSALGAA